MKLLGVNYINANAKCLYESEVFLHGVLKYNETNILIGHWPKAEIINKPNTEIWVYTGNGAFSFDKKVLKRISDKRVVVKGIIKKNNTIYSSDPGLWWHTHFLATELIEHKSWVESHDLK